VTSSPADRFIAKSAFLNILTGSAPLLAQGGNRSPFRLIHTSKVEFHRLIGLTLSHSKVIATFRIGGVRETRRAKDAKLQRHRALRISEP